jgi:transcriptional regulator with XRE-family HTH domain
MRPPGASDRGRVGTEPGTKGSFGELLRTARKRASYTVAGLAGLLAIPPAELSAVERGREAPLAPNQIERAARILDTDPKPLLAAAEQDFEREFHRQWPGLPRTRRSARSTRS